MHSRVPSVRCLPGLLVLASVVASCGQPAPEPGPNLLIVLLDTTRADHIGCYGGAPGTTPTIDSLAARGTRFDEALAQSSLTPVSAGSILTGTYPFRHGIRSLFAVGKQSLSGEAAPLAELLSEHGFATGAFVSAMPMGGEKYGLARGFDVYSDEPGPGTARAKELGLPNPNQRRADATTDAALAWLDDHARADTGRFGLLVHFFDAHDATLVPPVRFLAQRMQLPAQGETPTDAQRIELYDAEIEYMDRQVARLLAKLEERGVLDNTLVVVIADHGESLGQHDFWTHGLLWREQLRVPLILAGPGVPAGLVLRDRVRMVDVLPTLVELLGVADDDPRDGHSFAGLLAGDRDPEPRELYAEVHHAEKDFLGRDEAMITIARGRWKYVWASSGREQLYDLEADPDELDNLFDEQHPEVAALRARLAELGALDGHRASTEGMTETELEALRGLGYVGDDDEQE